MSLISSRLVASAANALLEHVTPSLRACMIELDEQEKTIHSYFIYDQEVDNFLLSLGSCVSTEIIASLECAEIQLCKDHFIHFQIFRYVLLFNVAIFLKKSLLL